MKKFIFTFLLSALVLCAGLNVSFGSHEIQKFDKVKIEKKSEMKKQVLLIGEADESPGKSLLIGYILNRKNNVAIPEVKLDLLNLPYHSNVRQVDINKGPSIKLCRLAKKYMSRSTC